MLDADKSRKPSRADADSKHGRSSAAQAVSRQRDGSDAHVCTSHYESLVRLYELEMNSLQELFDFALEEGLVLTQSAVGYICFYDEATHVFTLYSWSKDVMAACRVENKPDSFFLEETGIWGEVVRQRRPIVINDYDASHPLKKGCPAGHVTISNFLSLPVWRGSEIIAVIAVGNKQGDYTECDVRQLDLFAKGVWVIARRKEAEEALRLSEERYRSVVEDQTDVIFRFTPAGCLQFVNTVCCRFFGRSFEMLLGSCWAPAVVAEGGTVSERILAEISPEHPVVTMECQVYNAQGEARWMQFVSHAILDANGAIVEIQSVGRDITEHKEAEEALRESKLRWKFALEGSGDGVWDWNLATNTLFFSERCKSMLGYAADEIGSSPMIWKYMIHPEDLESCLKELYRHFRGETAVYEREHRLRCKDGSYRWVLHRGKVVQTGAKGKPERVIGTITDITERKHIEALKEEVNTIMRHDLRSPLIDIVGLPDILLENKTISEREREILYAIQDSGYKILTMIDNSINIYKMELGSYQLNPVREDLISMLFKAIDGLRRQFKHKKITFSILVDGREVSKDDRFLVLCEEDFCSNMISNLLINATEASPFFETIQLLVSTQANSLSIVNKGAVPEAIRDRFFEKYVTAGKKNGTGLGTYSAALIARTHGWTISLDTSVPDATTVTVSF